MEAAQHKLIVPILVGPKTKIAEIAKASGVDCISTQSSKVYAWVIPTNEELMIAQHARSLLGLK
jgi:acetate kinase